MISYLPNCYGEEDSDGESASILNPLLYVMPKIADVKSKQDKDGPNSCADAMFGRKTQKYALYFIIFFLACLTIKDLVELISEYMSDPKQSDLTIRFNDSMELPNMTFCMDSKMAKSFWNFNTSELTTEWDKHVEESLSKWNKSTALDSRLKWDDRVLSEAFDFLATINSFERESEASHIGRVIYSYNRKTGKDKKKLIEKWLKWTAEQNITFPELIQKVGEQIFLKTTLKFVRTTFNESEPTFFPKPKIQWISQQQVCFSPIYDAKSYRPIADQGKFFSFTFITNITNMEARNETFDCMHVDFHGRLASLNRFMEGKARSRDGFNDMVCVGQSHLLTLEVKTRSKMLPNDEDGTKCALIKDGDETEFECFSKCRLKLIKEVCNCTAHSLAYLLKEDEERLPMCNYLNCEINQTRADLYDYTEEPCRKECKPDCVQLRYTLTHSVLGKTFPNFTTQGEIHWGAFEYLNMEQSPVWTAWKFIAAVGGGIGVWLGLSVLSLIQGVGYLYNSFVQKVVVEKKPLIDEDTNSQSGSRRGSKSGITLSANPLTNPWRENNERKRSKDNTNGYSTHPNPATKIVVD